MLVLSRRIGEQIVVPEVGITFTILEIDGNKVRVGVEGPQEVRVYRRELWERMHGQAPTPCLPRQG